jgi:hypothetical protein
MDLLLKNSKNGAGRVTGLELGGEWMGKKIILRAPFIRFQGIIEY